MRLDMPFSLHKFLENASPQVDSFGYSGPTPDVCRETKIHESAQPKTKPRLTTSLTSTVRQFTRTLAELHRYKCLFSCVEARIRKHDFLTRLSARIESAALKYPGAMV